MRTIDGNALALEVQRDRDARVMREYEIQFTRKVRKAMARLEIVPVGGKDPAPVVARSLLASPMLGGAIVLSAASDDAWLSMVNMVFEAVGRLPDDGGARVRRAMQVA